MDDASTENVAVLRLQPWGFTRVPGGAAKREAGYQLDKLQRGRRPSDWKPMSAVGPGAAEIRIRDASGAYRVLYVAKFEDAVFFVLHCFQKKTQTTSKADLDLAARRYGDLARELSR